jgi:hypothetical protein
MVATLFLGGVLKAGAHAFATITGALVDFKTLRGVQREANNHNDMKVVEPTLILTDAELDLLAGNPTWAAGLLRAEAFKRHGSLGDA